MITNKDIRVENGSLILNGDPYPLDGQSPETIMEIVEDNSDSTPTENSTKPVKSGGIYSKIGDLTQTGLTGDSVAAQLGTAREQISKLTTPTPLWEGSATDIGNTYNMTGNYTDYKYLLLSAKTNGDVKNMLIPTSSISASTTFSDVLSGGSWNTTTNSFAYNSVYGIKFTAANNFQLTGLIYNNSNWIFKPVAIYGIG